MRPAIRFLFFLNLLIELLVPAVWMFFLISSAASITTSSGSFVTLILTFSLVLFVFGIYAVTDVKVNLRRFPRVVPKALMVVAVLFLVELMVYVASWNSPSAFFVVGTHVSTALLLVMFWEAMQKERIRLFSSSFPVVVLWSLGTFLIISVTNYHAVIIWTQHLASLYPRVPFALMQVIAPTIWGALLGILVLSTYYRAGRRLYAEKGYRPNAAVIVMNEKGQVLLCERSDRPGTIQTVQGGIDPGETPEQAAVREMQEELGLWPKQYELKAALLNTKKYDWQPRVQKQLEKTGYKGQEQYFFLVQTSSDVSFDLDYFHREFRRVWWGTPKQLLKLSWSKKRPGIESALKGFGLL